MQPLDLHRSRSAAARGMPMKTDVIIIGAGASGLMCAIGAGRRGRSVLVVDHAADAGRKILVSGGGRCNFSNREVGSGNYLSNNPHFAKSALSRFTPEDFLSMLRSRKIGYREEEGGRYFCSGGSREIVGMLREECAAAGVVFRMNCRVLSVDRGTGFRLETDKGAFDSQSLVIATGGLSYPQLGASNFGYAIAKRFGIKVTPLRPALTPLRFGPEDAAPFASLAGVSLDASVSYEKAAFKDKVLFTHTGLSGPAILQISSYWDRKGSIAVDLLPGVDISGILMENRRSKALLTTLLERFLPGRFVKAWCGLHIPVQPLNRYTEKEFAALAGKLHSWRIRPADTGGFDKAEVTLGGVDTEELSSRSMESGRIPGLYFLGEVMDVTGQLGGYNLHWAWASGHAAGECA
ncbi:MAG: NAD(P)/FAD-dependent oxidoreductase [Desulfobacteraceae bacterium]|nr:NAD(P)/FAD-dependent oxidoreductase [Desulfobacteraceae bacterium]